MQQNRDTMSYEDAFAQGVELAREAQEELRAISYLAGDAIRVLPILAESLGLLRAAANRPDCSPGQKGFSEGYLCVWDWAV